MRLPSTVPVAVGLLCAALVLLVAQSRVSRQTLSEAAPAVAKRRREVPGLITATTSDAAGGGPLDYSSTAISTGKQMSDLALYRTSAQRDGNLTSTSRGQLVEGQRGDASFDGPARGELVIGVLTDPNSLDGLPLAAYSTWAQDIAPYATVVFFVGSCEADVSGFPGDIRCLDTPDTYPPQRKVFLLWAYLAKHFGERFSWFMKVDHDTYVNAQVMRSVIRMLMTPKYLERPGYYGAQAKGRPEERGRLGLNGKAYCSGLGYVVNKPILMTLAEWGMDSLSKVASNHSDTEVGRCVHFHSRVECKPPGEFSFHQVYYQQDGRHVFPMKLISGGQMNLMFPKEPKATHFAAALLHPLKRPEYFHAFHKQTVSYLRPVQPPIAKDSFPASYKMAIRDLKKTCVNNPTRQVEKSKFSLPECSTPRAEVSATVPPVAFILTGSERSQSEALGEVQAALTRAKVRVQAVPIPGWSGKTATSRAKGQALYNAALRGVLTEAAASTAQRILVFEEDVVFSCHFKENLLSLLETPRCADHLYTQSQGGVLVLGADKPTPEGLDAIESDRSQAFADNDRDSKAAACYNVNGQVQGSFAMMLHRSVFSELIAWLDLRAQAQRDDAPFHSSFVHLADRGYIVRAAFPNLVLRRTALRPMSQALTGRELAVHLRWTEPRFCLGQGREVGAETEDAVQELV